MDNHPIPQDITGFQFKLIGKMTIRQFIYLAVGGIIAWFVFFILEPPALIRWPVSLISFGLGAMIAFVPIDGRPMDTMIRNFINALISPTQFIYQKYSYSSSEEKSQMPLTKPPAKNQVNSYNSSAPVFQDENSEPNINTPAPSMPTEIKSQPTPAQQEPPGLSFPDPTAMPSTFLSKLNEKREIKNPEEAQGVDEKENLKNQIQQLQKQLEEKPNQSAPVQTSEPAPQPQTQAQTVSPDEQKNLEQMLAESIRQKEALEKQIMEMQAKHQDSSKEKFTPITATQQKTTQRVRKVPADMASSVGIPDVPDAPNLITGIIKDPRGNPVSNILVEIKDTDSNPVRAFKTNKLGKFASATSLSNGKYVISFEDPEEKHKFDDIEIEMVGSNVMPLEVISVDPREELRRELFN